jgi:peptide/nickel transport system permease protein
MTRAGHLLVVLLCSTMLCFAMTEALPGDAASMLLGDTATPDQLRALRDSMGLDAPLPTRYLDWLMGAVRGDLGTSWRTGEPVGPVLIERFAVSAQLMLIALTGALLLSLPMALLATRYREHWVDGLISSLALVALSTPAFVVALLLILVFAIHLGWLPATGYVTTRDSAGAHFASLALPALTLAVAEVPVQLRILRGSLHRVIDAPFIRTARAYGASEWHLIMRGALRPASATFVTVLGLNIAGLIAGAIVVESIFALPGLGRLLVDAVYGRDIPTIQGCVLLVGVVYVFVNLSTDAACRWLDPRAGHRA